MPLQERQDIIAKIEEARKRKCIVLFNFDRQCFPHGAPGFSTQFDAKVKEPIYRVLKECGDTTSGVDVFIYTRGGDVNAVWPLVSLVREFDEKFNVLVPYGCHSSGTMFALGSNKIVLGPLSELSPIDPTCGNQFNPIDEVTKERLGISVEDVKAYHDFILRTFDLSTTDNGNVDNATDNATKINVSMPFMQQLSSAVHPLALGNVHRVYQQGRKLAKQLLNLNNTEDLDVDEVIDKLAKQFFSHQHMINRFEANDILKGKIEFADPELVALMDELLRAYETDFNLRKKFVVGNFLGDDRSKEARVMGGAVESSKWSYLHETVQVIKKNVQIPPNIQVHLKPGDDVNTIRGLPEQFQFELQSESWVRNTTPKGITT